MSHLADYYFMHLVIDEADVAEVTADLVAALAHPPWPAPTGWRSPVTLDDGPLETAPLLDAARAGTLGASVEWEHDKLVRGQVQVMDDAVVATLRVSGAEPGQAWRWLHALEETLERVVATGAAVRHAKIARRGSGVVCVPGLPLVDKATYVVAAHDEALAWAYESAEAMIAAGGWDVKTIEGCRVLSRAMHAETNVELLEAIQDGQWAMARVARPKFTTYDFQPARPEEEAIFHDGDRRVLAVGYGEDDQAAIYSCAIDEDEHVQPWEVWTLGKALRDRKLPSGEAVKVIRVVFSDRASAMRERRPLLDVGITVQCYDEGGALTTVPEAS